MTLRKQFYSRNKITLGKEAYKKLKEATINVYPDEACGILIGDEGRSYIMEIWPMGNKTEGNPHRFFRADPLELYYLELRAEKEGKQILGFYHSHPDTPAEISLEDEKYMLPGVIHMILSVNHGMVGKIEGYQKEGPEDKRTEIEVELEEKTP